MEELIDLHYGIKVKSISPVVTGVGGQTYRLELENEKYILKGVPVNDKHVGNEPDLATFLRERGFPVAEYIRNKAGEYFWREAETIYHMQRYVEGKILPFNEAPDWFMMESVETLGRIHSALSDFRRLPVGMGEEFLTFMRSDYPENSYRRTMEKAKSLDDKEILKDVEYRLSQIKRLREIEFDLTKFTCSNTHGDYKISQMICTNTRIAAIIDWTAACVHPVCWEIIRSYTYADPACKDGEIDADRFIKYVCKSISSI